MSDIDEPGSKPASTSGTIIMWIGAFVIFAVVGVLLFGVVSNMRRRPYRQPEARANLKAAYTAQKAYFLEKDKFDEHVERIGFSPERGNRYTYFFAERGPVQHRDLPELKPVDDAVIIASDREQFPKAKRFASFRETGCPVAPCPAEDGTTLTAPGIRNDPAGEGKNALFLVTAVGNIDDDDVLDCWSICSASRIGPDGHGVPAGEPLNDRSDVN